MPGGDGEDSVINPGISGPASSGRSGRSQVCGHNQYNTALYWSNVLETPRGVEMVVEYIRYTVALDEGSEFVAAYQRAGQMLDADPHCLGYEVAQGVEEPGHFVVRIRWDSIQGHEQGFRTGPHFGAFFSAVQPFFSKIEEMKHYEVRLEGAVPDVARRHDAGRGV
jgi:quinol monooxygenase YgiN